MPEPPSIPLEFPDKGIDVTREFAEQPPRTTADAVNVLSRESIAGRSRGGSRAGFSKYVTQQIPDGPVSFQHLEVIVDPTVEALQQNFETPGGDWIPHPRFPTILIPPDGAPWQPNPNAGQSSSSVINFVQSSHERIADLNAEETYDFATWFDLEPVIGNTIIVAIMMVENVAGGTPNVTNTITNGVGASYTRLNSGGGNAGYERTTVSGGFQMTLSLWWKKVEVEADKTLKINASAAGCFSRWIMAEYDDVATTTFNGFSFNNSGGPTTALSTGAFNLGSAGQMAVGAFATYRTANGTLTIPVMSGFTARELLTNRAELHFWDDNDHGAEVGLNITGTASNDCAYCAVGCGVFAD